MLSLALLWLASVANAAEDPGLVVRYDFAQGSKVLAKDVSGNQHDGVIEAGAFTLRAGRRALAANGSTTAIDLGSDPALNIRGDLTIEAWIKGEDSSGRDQLILGDTAGLAILRNYGLTLDRGFVRFEHGDGRTATEAVTSDQPLADGTWHHLVVVAEFPYCYIYLDGREIKAARMQFDIVPTQGGPRYAAGWWAGHLKGGLDDVRLYGRALSAAEIRAHADVAAPETVPTTIAVSPHYLLGRGEIIFDVACRGELPPQMQITVALVDARGWSAGTGRLIGLAPSRPASGRANFRVELPKKPIKPGRYRASAQLLTNLGMPIARAAERWDVPPRPAWLGAHEKSRDIIPPPYVALKTSAARGGGYAVQPIGRSYDLGRLALPTQLRTGDAEILAGPVQLVAEVAGKAVAWDAGQPRLQGSTSRRATFTGKAAGDGLAVSATATIEYDGFLRFDCHLTAPRPAQLGALTLEIPLKPAYARLFYYYPYDDGAVPARLPGDLDRDPPADDLGRERVLFSSPFRPIVWVGDNDRGLAWYCESDRNWLLMDPQRAIEIIRRGDQVLLRLRLTDQPRDLGPGREPLEYSFALQATPVKPMGEDCWDYRFSSAPEYGKDYEMLTGTIDGQPQLDFLSSRGVRTLILGNWTKVLCYPAPVGHEEQLRKLVKACHQRGMKVICYLGYQISELAPEWPVLGQEVVTLPLMRNPDLYPGEQPQMVDMICNRSVWPDRLVAGVGKLLDDYDVDGVYLDSPNMVFPCTNEDHGCGYRRQDGSLVGTFPIYATRDFFQRIYAAVKARKPDGVVDSHVYSCMNASTLAYATSYWNGEQLPQAPGGYIPDVLPLDMFRAMFMGRQWGTAAELLHYRLGGYAPCFAISLLHDVPVRAHASRENLDLMSTVWKAMDRYGRDEARFMPYWENGAMVTAEPGGVYVSFYLHPANGVRAIISNLGKTAADAEVTFDLGELGLAGRTLTASDALDGRSVELEGGRVRLALPSMGWQMVWLRPGKVRAE